MQQDSWSESCSQVAKSLGLRRSVQLLHGTHPALPLTWGFLRPRVLLPASAGDWTDERMRIVLHHELAHVARGDWLIQLVAESLRSFYWFNPLVWMICARLRSESEHACDDAVLGEGVDGSEYATHLLDLARTFHVARRPSLPAPAMARPSSLEGRIRAMLNARLNRSPLTRRSRVALIVGALLVAATIAGAQTYYSLSGLLLDPTNRFLPGVRLTLTNTNSQQKYEVTSDRTGRFEFVGLPSATYAMETRLPGFSTAKETITITGRNETRTIVLQVGSLEEAIRIVGSPVEQASDVPTPETIAKEMVRKLAQLEGARRGQERLKKAMDNCNAATPGPMGGNILPPMKIVDRRPVYPESLQKTNIGGEVVLDAVIAADGTVSDVRVVKSPHSELDSAAIEAVRQWQYTPTLLNCSPTDVRMTVTASFAVQP
jgi:TonB family protein